MTNVVTNAVETVETVALSPEAIQMLNTWGENHSAVLVIAVIIVAILVFK